MILRNLGSGSGGNATIVARDGRAILIDCGLSRSRILDGLVGLRLEAVLITHRHSDHLRPHVQELGAPIWIDRANWEDAKRLKWLGDRVRHFDAAPFRAGPFQVRAFPLPHPGESPWQSYGFFLEYEGSRIAYATDLGHVPEYSIEFFSSADVVFLESNHDPEMERASGRQEKLINWVLSPFGHLSNNQCAEALAKMKRPHTVILGHLSRECNRPDLARATAARALSPETRLLIADQDSTINAIVA